MAARRTYTDEDRARVAVALASNDGNVKRTARECDLPVSTVREWKKRFAREGLPEKVKSEVPAIASEFIERAERIRSKALAKLETAVDKGELKPKELLVAVGILTDKVQAIRNKGNARGGSGGTININLPSPKQFREQIEEYVTTIVANAHERDEIIGDVTEAEWEQADKKALPPAKD